MVKKWMIIFVLVLMVSACSPADPTRPPTRTPTRTISRSSLPSATLENTGTDKSATLGIGATPPVTIASSTAAPVTLSPTIDPLVCLPDDVGQTGLVSWVIDGATFVIDIGGRYQTIRLLGIDAPPLTADITRSLIDKRVVRIVPDGPQRDVHGRWLRYVLLLDDRFVNDELLRTGAARLDANVGGLSCMAQFDAAEAVAKESQIGLWDISAIAALPTSFESPTATTQLLTSTGTVESTASPTIGPSLTPTRVVTPGGPTATATVTSQAPPPAPPTITAPPTTTRPVATGTMAGTGVQIVFIFYDGLQNPNEPDEYIEIRNFEATPVDMTDWWIYAEYEGQFFSFTEFTLQPAESCRVYTDQIHDDSCAENSFLSILPIWNNDGDCGYLFDADNEEKSVMCYGDYE